jgi:ATP-dependent protease ClpP protease subunit
VAINSPGGSVFDGLAIFNALRMHPARIITRVDGLAASAASFIAQAGDERIMVDSSQMMVHNAWGVAAGNAADMRDFADFLEQQSVNIAELYAARSTSHDATFYSEMMSSETWLSAAQAVESGLADRVLTPERPSAAEASNKFSTEAPDESPALVAGDGPAADVAQTHRRNHALVSQLAIIPIAERSASHV